MGMLQHRKILIKAVEKFGEKKQTDVFKEELAELIVAVCHYERGKVGLCAVINEMADVIIMLTQYGLIHDINNTILNNAITSKVNRLKTRVES